MPILPKLFTIKYMNYNDCNNLEYSNDVSRSKRVIKDPKCQKLIFLYFPRINISIK